MAKNQISDEKIIQIFDLEQQVKHYIKTNIFRVFMKGAILFNKEASKEQIKVWFAEVLQEISEEVNGND